MKCAYMVDVFRHIWGKSGQNYDLIVGSFKRDSEKGQTDIRAIIDINSMHTFKFF